MEKLRFAPLIRVSTEKQEDKSESLRVQKDRITRAVEYLSGTIPDYCWKYCGQEHATPEYERVLLDNLLSDCRKGLFDAVIVDEVTRWARDNAKSKAGLEIFRKHGVRFFVNTMELDLFNPTHNLMVGMSVEAAEFQAASQAQKSLLSRIQRVKDGYPSAGFYPYGRRFNKEIREWEVIPERKRVIQEAAKEFLNGASLRKLAQRYKMNYSNLVKILRERCGDTWDIHFRSKKFNIDVTVPMKVPRLLPEETILKIRERLAANRTILHGQIKNYYLLGRMMFCEDCGCALSAQKNHWGKSYYRHPKARGCYPFGSVPAPAVEGAVMGEVFDLLGDKVKMEEAARMATPDLALVKELQTELSANERQFNAIEKRKDVLLDLVETGALTAEQVSKRMKGHEEQQAEFLEKIQRNKAQLASLPSKEEGRMRSQLIRRVQESYLRSRHRLSRMSPKDKRALLLAVFQGKGKDGRRNGVYVKRTGDNRWLFTLRGLFGEPVLRVASKPDEGNDNDIVNMQDIHHADPVGDTALGNLHLHAGRDIHHVRSGSCSNTDRCRHRPLLPVFPHPLFALVIFVCFVVKNRRLITTKSKKITKPRAQEPKPSESRLKANGMRDGRSGR